MNNPNHLFRKHPWLDGITAIPLILLFLPFPLLIPIGLIAMAFDDPNDWPLPVIYFTYLGIAWFIILLNETDLYYKFFRK